MDVAFVRISVSNLIIAVVIEEEVQAKMVSKACCCNGAGSPILRDAVALPGLDIAKAENLLAIAVYKSHLSESLAKTCGVRALTILEESLDGHSIAHWQCRGNRQDGRCGQDHGDGCREYLE
jgi:hypothetical protein